MRGFFTLSCLGLAVSLVSCQRKVERQQCIRVDSPDPVRVESSATPLKATYLLSKPDPSVERFLVQLSLRFEATDGVTDAILSNYRSRFERCLKTVSPYLRGADGAELVLDIRPAIPGLDPIAVKVTDNAAERGHWRLWRSDWLCPSMIHEVAHPLGLVDEYSEADRFPARVVGPANSLMVSPEQTFAQTMPKRQAVLCSCTTERCILEIPLLRVLKKEECPTGASRFVAMEYPNWLAEHPVFRSTEQRFLRAADNREYRYISETAPAPGASLLFPAQFEAIVRPGCDGSSQYALCAASAYEKQRHANPPDCSGGMRWLE